MSAITRCPRCSVWYRIGPHTLEEANGLVRCGRCGEIFDARITLWSESSAPSPASREEAAAPGTDAPAGPPPGPPDPEDSDEPRLGGLEDLDLEDPSTPVLAEERAEEEAFAAVEDPFTIPPTDPIRPATVPPRPVPRRRRGPGWLLGDLFLALLLGGSLVYLHPWRSGNGAPLSPADRSLAATVRSDPEAFRITAAEVVPSRAHPRTGLVVAGTILNTTARKSALPWLLVRLTDVAGRTLVTGAFPPGLYAPHAQNFLRGRHAVPFRLRVLAPRHAAAGFRIRLCRGRPPRLECR